MWQKNNEACYKQVKLFKKYREKLNTGYLRIMITPALVKKLQQKTMEHNCWCFSVNSTPAWSLAERFNDISLQVQYILLLLSAILLLLQKQKTKTLQYICQPTKFGLVQIPWRRAESRTSSSTEKRRYLKNLQYREKEGVQTAST